MSEFLSVRERLLSNKAKNKTDFLFVPEWNINVYLRSWNMAELHAFQVHQAKCHKEDLTANVVIFGAYEDAERTQPIFFSSDLEGVRELEGHVLERVAKGVLLLNGASKEAFEEAKKP